MSQTSAKRHSEICHRIDCARNPSVQRFVRIFIFIFMGARVSRWFRNHPPTLRRRHRQGSASATVGFSALDNDDDVHDDDDAGGGRRSVSTKSILSRSIFKTRGGRGKGGRGRVKWAIEKEEERDSQGGLGTATANEQSHCDKV